MEVQELISYRGSLLSDAADSDGFVSQQDILPLVLPLMLDAKLVDSEDYNDAFYTSADNGKINAYAVNDTGERLQIFLVDDDSVRPLIGDDEVLVSERKYYEGLARMAKKFIRGGLAGSFIDAMQDADPVKVLASKLQIRDELSEFDVVEVFVISLKASVSFRGPTPRARQIHIKSEEVPYRFHSEDGQKHRASIEIQYRVIDLNFLAEVETSRGRREPLIVDFQRDFDLRIEVIEAGHEGQFRTYLCVLDGEILYKLYRKYSSRMLEKNVRSFLQVRQATNKGIRETIRKEPEKFVAFNNGLTITATGSKTAHYKKRLYLEQLTDFQIVNGGQTMASIFFAHRDGIPISDVKVMAKINVLSEQSEDKLDDLISQISQYSNTQTRVSAVDLRSRNPSLILLKRLSESVPTPFGTYWFFERARGEFNTKVRLAGRNADRLKKQFPVAKRFSKEQLAKYYTAWGDNPHLVKKGGEKVFRLFIEELSTGGAESTPLEIDRTFYEEVVAKVIVFRRFEEVYGAGKNAMGQLRSAVVPYAMSALYRFATSKEERTTFDLARVWREQGLDDTMSTYGQDLLRLMNELIKKYSMSEDYGEYAKKQELWESIRESSELSNFFASDASKVIRKKYVVRT